MRASWPVPLPGPSGRPAEDRPSADHRPVPVRTTRRSRGEAAGDERTTAGCKRLPGYDVLEQVGQVRLWGVEHGEVLTLQVTQIPADRTLVRVDRMHVVDDTESEQPPDDAGHLQRQLVTGRKAVDPPGHHCLHCVGEARRAQIARAGCDGADTVGDTDQPGVAQRVGELLAEERVALGALLN